MVTVIQLEALQGKKKKSILLYGPPGTGKTLLAKAVARLLHSRNASSVDGTIVSLSSSDIVRASVGSGEKMVVFAFESARMNAPSVVFIDEFQALFTERSSDGSGRLSSTLQLCKDNVKQWRDADANAASTGQNVMDRAGRVVVLAATNNPVDGRHCLRSTGGALIALCTLFYRPNKREYPFWACTSDE